jgi:predicted ATP-grasp superfamily ATP-dependent carboligase
MDLVRALGLAGIRSVVVARPGAPTRFSRFTRGALEWRDAWEQPEALVELLLRFAKDQPDPPVLFYEEDRDLLLVSRHRARLAEAFRFVVPEAGLVEDLVDKSRFDSLARRLGLPVPPGLRLHPAREPLPSELGLAFPLVLKPLTRRPDRWDPIAHAAKALRVDTRGALAELWPKLAASDLVLLAQELVPGDETRIESYHVYVDGEGRVVGEFTGRKIRTSPRAYGDSTALVISDAPDVAALGRELAERLGLRGVAKFDFKRGPDGRLHLLEINPRFTLWSHPGAVAGVNLPALVYADLAGRPRGAATRARAGVRWCRIWEDRGAARAAGVPFVRWLPWALRCEAKRAVAWDDPLPLVCGAVFRWLGRSPPPFTPGPVRAMARSLLSLMT